MNNAETHIICAVFSEKSLPMQEKTLPKNQPGTWPKSRFPVKFRYIMVQSGFSLFRKAKRYFPTRP
mgnify:CR=1 FL=1